MFWLLNVADSLRYKTSSPMTEVGAFKKISDKDKFEESLL